MTYDDTHLFSAGEDGSLFIFDVKRNPNAKGAAAKDANAIGVPKPKEGKEGVLPFADEILVTKSFLEGKQKALG